jgi:hypothetical protein
MLVLLPPIQKDQGSGLGVEIVKLKKIYRVFLQFLQAKFRKRSNYVSVAPMPFHVY